MDVIRDWSRTYRRIAARMGHDPSRDLLSSRILERFLERLIEDKISVKRVKKHDRKVALVVGGSESVLRDLRILEDQIERFFVIAADGASRAILELGRIPDVIVTDLDGSEQALLECSRKGSLLFVHAHGDNIDRILELVPKLDRIIGTSQHPESNLINLHGYTDGDRALSLALMLGFDRIVLAGMDLAGKTSDLTKDYLKSSEKIYGKKRKKLEIARSLISSMITKSRATVFSVGETSIDVPVRKLHRPDRIL